MSQFPNVALPAFEVNLPSNPKIIYRFRPFLVKEEKLLLLLDENSSVTEITRITLDLIKRCCLNEKFDFDSLSYFDIEYLFLALRARSVGEIQEVIYQCANLVDGRVCGNHVPLKVDFTKMEVIPENHSTIVFLSNGVSVEMRYPTEEIVRAFTETTNKEAPTQNEIYEASIEFISSLVMKIMNDNGAIKRDVDFSQSGCKDWIETLTHNDFAKLQKFVETMPKVVIKCEFVCNKCGYKELMILESLQSFFE